MLSRKQETILRKLRQRKHRWKQRLFIAEGRKVVHELLAAGLEPQFLVTEEAPLWEGKESITVGSPAFREWSQLSQADEVIGVFSFPEYSDEKSGPAVIIDGVSDPGNLGTIIRSCDWFGIKAVYCSTGTADVYNAKAVQSTMGSIARVRVQYAAIEEIFEKLNHSHRLLRADMSGIPYKEVVPGDAYALVVGSESHGPSEFWDSCSEAITIPRAEGGGAESLNVGVATSIILAHLSI